MAYSGFASNTLITVDLLNAAADTYSIPSGSTDAGVYLRSGCWIVCSGSSASNGPASATASVYIYRYTDASKLNKNQVAYCGPTEYGKTIYIDNIGGEGWYQIKAEVNQGSGYIYSGGTMQPVTVTAAASAVLHRPVGTAVRGNWVTKFYNPLQSSGRDASAVLTASVLNSGLCGTISSL